MIITDDKRNSPEGGGTLVEINESDPPPYSAESSQPTSSDIPEPIRNIRPSNYFYISNNIGSIKGTYVIDPFHDPKIPASLLPALADGETRKNLYLHSSTGIISADVWIRPGSASSSQPSGIPHKKRTTIEASSNVGPITVKMHASPEAPFILKCNSNTAPIRVYLPRPFNGLLTVSTNVGAISYSSELAPHVTVFSEVSGKRHCYIGEGWAGDGDTWEGSAVHLSTKVGPIKVSYTEERKTGENNGGLFNSILGGLGFRNGVVNV